MSTYRNILAAIDFSPENRRILDRATGLAGKTGSRLTLLHVVEYTEFAYSGDLIAPEELAIDDELVGKAKKEMAKLQQELDLGEIDARIEMGTPKREIVRIAEEVGADLIVLGSHGRHGLQLLLGSTANGVLHLAGCDVLAVRVGEQTA
jgi:universal stress protein A